MTFKKFKLWLDPYSSDKKLNSKNFGSAITCDVTFAHSRVPSNFAGNLLIELYAKGLETRVELSVL